MRSRLKLCVAVTFALSAMQAQAVGLGTIEVKSRLNQPFVAEIPLTLNSPDEANDLVVRLASSEAFDRVGLERSNEVSANLQFTVGRNTRGEPVVRVTTPQKMHDPYVSFLLEADWGKGKMVREYTALLDPPHTASVPRRAISAPTVVATPLPAPIRVRQTAPPAVMPTVPAPTVAAQPEPVIAAPEPYVPAAAPMSEPLPPPPQSIVEVPQPQPLPPINASPSEPMPEPIAAAPQPIAAAPQPEPALPAEPEQAPAAAVASEVAPPPPAPRPESPAAKAAPDAVTVGHGDTLSKIAGQVRPGDVSVNRMMIALQRTNPDAFIHDNINLLKSGAVLRIPGSEQTRALTADEANALVHEQVESWRQTEQPAPQLQPGEGPETAVAKASKPVASRAPAVAAAKQAESTPDATPTADSAPPQASVAPKSAPHVASSGTHKPRGARLEIVPPAGNTSHNSQTGASEGGSGSELRAQLAQTKEELAARNSEVGDLKSRVADMEKMQKDSQQLLTMKDSQLADMQQRLAELQKNAAAVQAASSSAPANAAAAAPVPNNSTAAVASATSVSQAAVSTVAGSTIDTKPETPAAAATPAATEPAEPVTPWYLRPLVLIGAGLLVLAGLLGLMLRRPRAVEPAARPRSFGNGALATGIASAPVPDADAADEAHDDALKSSTQTPVTIEPAASEAAHKPYWTGGFVADPQAEAAAQSSAAAPVAAAAAAAVSANATAAHAEDNWPIDNAPQSAPTTPDVTKVRSAVPALDDPNQTVATKLELARAYIDIGDSDGARGMLEEVLIEGNGTQQEEAFKLLDTLDG